MTIDGHIHAGYWSPQMFLGRGASFETMETCLAECGIDILNPLEPLEATDWKAIKQEYGDGLCFMGGVDLKKALRGTVQEVEKDVRRCLETFAEGGGYILTAANHMPPDIPPQNVAALFEAGKRLGAYPLNL